MRLTFNLMLSFAELLIGLRFAIKIFTSDDTLGWVLEDVKGVLGQMDQGSSVFIRNTDIQGPFAFLLFVLGFMIFAYAMMIILPRMVEKTEKRMKLDMDIDEM